MLIDFLTIRRVILTEVEIKDTVVNRVEYYKYSGVVVDHTFSWTSHVDLIDEAQYSNVLSRVISS